MGSNNNLTAVPIYSIPENAAILMSEFRGLQIYASCAIAIYFYELIVCSLSKDIKWYKTKLWSVPEIVCFFLEKFRIFYPKRPYLAISLFLLAILTVIFQMMNVLGIGAVDVNNKLDGNCYLMSALEGNNKIKLFSGFFSIGFIMLMIYCWIIWIFVGYSLHSTKNLHYYSKRRYWRRILFDDGFMYFSLIAFSQAINIIFIIDGKNYLRKYINTTPLLVLTSICTQKLLVNIKLFINNDDVVVNNGVGDSFRSFSFINEKGVDRLQEYKNQPSPGSFIDQFYLQGQDYNQQDEILIRIPSPTYSSFTSSTKVNSMPPSLPPVIVHKNTNSDIYEEEEVRYSYVEYDEKMLLSSLDKLNGKRRTTQDFGGALLEYFNSLTLSRCASPVTSTYPINRSSSNNLAPRDSEQINNFGINKISRLSNLNMNGFNNKERMSSQSRLSQGIRKSKQQSQPILVDPNDIYYFTYSYDNDNEIYLFPAIQIQSDQEEENMKEKSTTSNNYVRKSNESLTPPSIRHQSFAFTGKITPDNSDNNLADNKKIVRASDIESILSKEKNNDKQYGFI
ncbi:5308_t:CDS:2 [Rhizophagus irregularis]|nr:5308_t:CDS:2 [Rhizophagus irregularis]